LRLQALEEAKAMPKIEYNQNGTMAWDSFLTSSKIANKYAYLHTKDRLKQSVELRRKIFKEQGLGTNYRKIVQDTQKWKKGCKIQMQAEVYKSLNVPKTVFIKSVKEFLAEEDKRKEYDQAMIALRKEALGEETKEMSKDEVLDAVRFIEEEKLKNFTTSVEMMKKSAPIAAIYLVMKLQSTVLEDKLAIEKSIEMTNVKANIASQNLKQDDDFKAIVEEFKGK